MLKNEKKVAEKYELNEAIKFIRLVASMQFPQFEPIRRKRQAGPVSCATLQNDLFTINGQISVLESQNITDVQAVYDAMKQKVETFKIKVSTSTGSSLTLNEKLLTAYTNLAASTWTKLGQLKMQLTDLQNRKAQIEANIESICNTTARTFAPAITTTTTQAVPTTPTPDPCARNFTFSFACGEIGINFKT